MFLYISGMFDADHCGSIDFDEFQALWKYVTDWQNCFKSFDSDNSGSISKDELRNALTTFGTHCCPLFCFTNHTWSYLVLTDLY